MEIQAQGTKVFVIQLSLAEKTEAGIFLPKSAREKQTDRWQVVSVGPLALTPCQNGPAYKEGDIVGFDKRKSYPLPAYDVRVIDYKDIDLLVVSP